MESVDEGSPDVLSFEAWEVRMDRYFQDYGPALMALGPASTSRVQSTIGSRAAAVESAIANSALSGFELGEAWKAMAQRFVDGEINTSDMIERIKRTAPAPDAPRDRNYESRLVAVRLIELEVSAE